MRSCDQGARGFTLVELLVVVAIVGVLGAVAAPSMSRTIRRDSIRKEARKIAEIFHEARGEAGATGRAMFVKLVGEPGTSVHEHIVKAGPTSSCSLPGGTGQAWWETTPFYIEQDTAGAGNASIVPISPQGSFPGGSIEACYCIKPSGRLYQVVCSGGTEQVYSGKLEVWVDDVRHAAGTDIRIVIGINSAAKVYGR